jgi:hypothetical protein
VQVRGRRYGFFLKAQSGYFSWSNVITKVTFPTPSTFVFSYGSRTSFASAVGAGFEYSPSGRIHFRADVSDLIIRYSSTSWTNNLQPTAGVYYGLGKPIDWRPPTYSASMAHPFFDRANLALISASTLGITADAVTTQRFISQGARGRSICKTTGQVWMEWTDQCGIFRDCCSDCWHVCIAQNRPTLGRANAAGMSCDYSRNLRVQQHPP